MAKNKNRVSPANLLAIIGLAGIGVLTFFGVVFQSEDGQPGGPIIKAAALTAGLGLLIILMVRAKTTEDDFNMWRVTEWVCLGAYLVVAALFYKPTLQFFHVVQHKEEFQTMAMKEMEQMDSLCTIYSIKEMGLVNEAADMIESYLSNEQSEYGVEDDGGLFAYIDKKETRITAVISAQPYGANEDADVSDAYNQLQKYEDYKKDTVLMEKISRWNLLDLADIAIKMKDLSSTEWTKLDNHIKENEKIGIIPSITRSENGIYVLKGVVNHNIGSKPGVSPFYEKFREPVTSNNVGWIVYVVLNIMVLLNYLLVRRSPIVQIRKDKRDDDGGLVLEVRD